MPLRTPLSNIGYSSASIPRDAGLYQVYILYIVVASVVQVLYDRRPFLVCHCSPRHVGVYSQDVRVLP